MPPPATTPPFDATVDNGSPHIRHSGGTTSVTGHRLPGAALVGIILGGLMFVVLVIAVIAVYVQNRRRGPVTPINAEEIPTFDLNLQLPKKVYFRSPQRSPVPEDGIRRSQNRGEGGNVGRSFVSEEFALGQREHKRRKQRTVR